MIRFVLAVLSRHLLALLFMDSVTLLLIPVVGFRHWYLLAHLFRLVVSHLLVLSRAFLLVFSLALFLGYILTLLLRHFLALLPVNQRALLVRNLFTHLALLFVTLLGRNQGGDRLLDVFTLLDRHQSAELFRHRFAHLLSLMNCVGNSLCSAALTGHLRAHLLGYLLTYLPGLIPALPTRLIPALLHSINIDTLLLGDGCALLLSDSITHFLIFCVTVAVVGNLAVLLILGL